MRKHINLVVGRIYGQEGWSRRYRIIREITTTHVTYDIVGTLLIRDAIHVLPNSRSTCKIDTFKTWARNGTNNSTDVFIARKMTEQAKRVSN
jgi:hypothetical protein